MINHLWFWAQNSNARTLTTNCSRTIQRHRWHSSTNSNKPTTHLPSRLWRAVAPPGSPSVLPAAPVTSTTAPFSSWGPRTSCMTWRAATCQTGSSRPSSAASSSASASAASSSRSGWLPALTKQHLAILTPLSALWRSSSTPRWTSRPRSGL